VIIGEVVRLQAKLDWFGRSLARHDVATMDEAD
jgi:hypothetical protein